MQHRFPLLYNNHWCYKWNFLPQWSIWYGWSNVWLNVVVRPDHPVILVVTVYFASSIPSRRHNFFLAYLCLPAVNNISCPLNGSVLERYYIVIKPEKICPIPLNLSLPLTETTVSTAYFHLLGKILCRDSLFGAYRGCFFDAMPMLASILSWKR